MPVNWYAALVVIVVLGIGSVALARYHYGRTAPATQPTIGQTWHAGLAFDICGTTEPALAASAATSTSGLASSGSGVLLIAPKTSAEAGNNATLGKFASAYTGLTLTNTTVKYPGGTAYKNGDKCPAGTPDAGKKGEVRARSWVLSTGTGKGNQVKQVGGAYAAQPKNLKFQNRQLITVGFVPSTASLPKPPGTTTVALLNAIEGTTPPVSTTTTTAPTTSSTTAPSGTTTTVPAATTTTAPTTTTTKPTTTTTSRSVTTTTKPTK
jgi:hypothetical protein